MHQVSQLTLLSESEVKPEKFRMSRFRVPACVTSIAHGSMLGAEGLGKCEIERVQYRIKLSSAGISSGEEPSAAA